MFEYEGIHVLSVFLNISESLQRLVCSPILSMLPVRACTGSNLFVGK